ncbi:MAG: hypothetical protein O3A85_01205 [Proteobacteria bacterium]|nr:hypothetical protein [Pseudomonadota bacterium]
MGGIEDFMKTFGFSQNDALTIIIICVLVMMANFAGGLFTSIIRAFGGPIKPSKLTGRTSFRLALVSELFLIIYVVYYHTVLFPGIETAQIIYWAFVILATPLLAAIGSQLIHVAMGAKIEELEKEGRRLAELERKGASSDKAEKDGGEK